MAVSCCTDFRCFQEISRWKPSFERILGLFKDVLLRIKRKVFRGISKGMNGFLGELESFRASIEEFQ